MTTYTKLKDLAEAYDNEQGDAYHFIRESLCTFPEQPDHCDELAPFLRDDLFELLTNLIADPYSRDSLTELALSLSLCPLHFVDYAICFDDLNPECREIRRIHPTHDT